ncbi:BTAD domain-containing putative transcriptional regulator [Agromyces sp. H66]|uniref:AfsR/SARP family transcriptional regulator n=1 Tax=Agromyces sp. H66 TaxID=2529859 RepID=UPI0010AB0CCB|nr:BTAD domain-containing putative transcriptional regulator [Agromyces sp. H66]
MGTRISLLGAPGIEVDGAAVPGPRGSKAWAILAYLALADRPVPRARLLDLLFDEAEDPGAALRWSLSQLRRALGDSADLTGDPVRFERGPDTVVDVDVVLDGLWSQALELPNFGGALLEGVSLRTGPAFDLWLSGERRRLASATATMLHEGAHARLARGDVGSAVALAERLVAAEPLEEAGHELLVRALMAAGDPAAAAERARQCRDIFARELGSVPSPAVQAALRPRVAASAPQGRSAVLAAIDVGVGAAHGGAYDRAIEALRQAAAADADTTGEVQATALASLGSVLVHGVRGSDEEAIGMLHRAFAMATDCGARPVAARAALELGVVETLRAHYPRMESWLAEATALADGDDRILAWIDLYAGLGRTDQGDYASAAETLDRAQEHARRAGELRVLAYAATGTGRLHLLRGELVEARDALVLACSTAREIGWTAFVPFPQALLAEVDVLEGDVEAAEAGFDHSYALACQVGDPCWESYALRGRGLVAAARGDDASALDLLAEAPRASRRIPDTHAWVDAFCLDALCDFAVARGLPAASDWVDELEAFASRRGMRELVARAALHRVRLGQTGAVEAAALALTTIDNPALDRIADAAGVPSA